MHSFWEQVKVTVGTGLPILAAVASWQEHLEWSLRIVSLLVGIAVGVLALVDWWRK